MKRKLICLFICLVMCISLLPAAAVAAGETVIDAVAVTGFGEPAAGAAPVTASDLKVPDGAPYEIDQLVWVCGETQMNEAFQFEAGKAYYAVISILPKEGYKFEATGANGISGSLSGTIDGSRQFVYEYESCVSTDSSPNGVLQLVTIDFNMTDPSLTPIKEVEVTGFVEPVPGADAYSASVLEVPTGAHYTVDRILWFNADNGNVLDLPFKFEAGQKYKASIYLVPNSGYKFADNWFYGIDQFDKCWLNGGEDLLDPNNSGVSVNGELGLKTKGLTPSEPGELTVITDVRVTGFVIPEAGENAIGVSALSVPADAPYTVEDIVWYDSNNDPQSAPFKFKGGQSYDAAIYIVPKSGYKFATVGTGLEEFDVCTLNGGTDLIYKNGSGAYTANGYPNGRLMLLTNTYPLPCTITFDPNGGTCSTASAKTADGRKLSSLPEITAPAGKAFEGWYTEKTGGTKVTVSYKFSEDTTIYAHYYEFTTQPAGGTVTNYEDALKVTWATNFTPVKLERGVKGGIRYEFDDPAATTFDFGASATAYNIRAYYGTGENDYIESSDFNVSGPVTFTFLKEKDSTEKYEISSTSAQEVTIPTYDACGFTAPEGKTFVKWVMADDTSVKHEPGAKIKSSVNAVFYPEFENTKYAITVLYGTGDRTEAEKGTVVNLKDPAETADIVFDKWVAVKGTVTLADAAKKTTTFTMPGEEVEVKATFLWKITAGKDGSWAKKSGKTLSFTCAGPFGSFTELQIDGKTVDPANYTKKTGSTIVELKNDYLESLGIGKHTIKFLYGGERIVTGSEEGSFTIKAANNVPATGDSFSPWALAAILILSGTSLAAFTLFRKKHN